MCHANVRKEKAVLLTRAVAARDCEVVDCPPDHHVNVARSGAIDANRTAFDEICIRCETGTYQVKPTSNKNVWVLWIAMPLVAVSIAVALIVTAWMCRQSIYMMCCRKPDFKFHESTDYYRSPTRPPMLRRSMDVNGYRNYPPRRQDVVRPSQTFSTTTVVPRRISTEDASGWVHRLSRFRNRHLHPRQSSPPGPNWILLEEQARRRALVTVGS
ncbi:hypothetical protein OSTOST_21439 [Ostertagia ostertagi]